MNQPTTLAHDRRGAAALEFALVFPVVILFVLGLFAVYDLVMARRAMDVGISKALRYAVVNAGATPASVSAVYVRWATIVASSVGTRSVVTVTPASVGGKVVVAVSYSWTAPAGLGGTMANAIFGSTTLNAKGSMRVMH